LENSIAYQTDSLKAKKKTFLVNANVNMERIDQGRTSFLGSVMTKTYLLGGTYPGLDSEPNHV
jgi:hypothetical protein